MKKIFFGLFTIVFLASFSVFANEDEAKDDRITGEVMDLACYTAHPDTGKGLSHAKCAKECIQKGIPAGILTEDGTLYIALGAEHGPANKMLASFAGKVVKVEGHIKEMNGVKFVEVEKIGE